METIHGVAIFQVDKDAGVTELILGHAGLSPVTLTGDYYEYLDIVESEFASYLNTDNLEKTDKAFELSSITSSHGGIILVRMYSKDYIVKKMLIISLRRGIIARISKRLINNGMTRLMLFEAYRVPNKMRHLR
ncbi:MAG: hypothetical protein RXO22_05670 [Thermocladium sp.]|jgi:hypothetical protein|nr:MAG: hypothetical protein AT710_05305 [Thermocladium sp. ECH_B]